MSRSFKTDYQIVLQKKLRTCQREAIEAAQVYLRRLHTQRSCLISMPTGAGKTGVIAVVSHLARAHHILIVCHRRAIREQLIHQIAGAFFQKVSPNQTFKLKTIHKLGEDWSAPGIYVTTFQKLTQLTINQLNSLRTIFGLVIIDEGHSEPAPAWGNLFRGTDIRKIIVTATPYRNDLFQFDIGPEHGYIHTFSEAQRSRILCPVVFEPCIEDALIDYIQNLLTKQPDTLCIVKCPSFEEVERYVSLLEKAFTVLAVHDRYRSKKGENKFRSVPKNIDSTTIQVIVHENKLDEGIDLPCAKILVLTYAVGSGRELVQAVGRVVRRFGQYHATVLDLTASSNQTLWQNYLAFDQSISSEEGRKKFLRSLDLATLLDGYLDYFPTYGYFGGTYKKRFAISQFDPRTSLNIKRASVCLLEKQTSFSMPMFTDVLYWRLAKQGALVRPISNVLDFNILVFVMFDNSPFLRDSLFFEPQLGIILVKAIGDIVVVYDSRSVNHAQDNELGLGRPIPAENLLSLAASTDRVAPREVHTRTIGTIRNRPEGTSMKGQNLSNVPVSAANASTMLSIAKFNTENLQGNRVDAYYIGTRTGRVVDEKQSNFSLDDFNDWVDKIHKHTTEVRAIRSDLFNSFAKPVDEKVTEDPIAVLVDLTDLKADVKLRCGNQQIIVAPEFFYERYDAGFRLSAQPQGLPLSIDYDDEKQQLLVLSENKISFAESGHDFGTGDNFLEWLNKRALKALYANAVSYHSGRFYRTQLPSERGINLEETRWGAMICAVEDLLGTELTEKGQRKKKINQAASANDSFDSTSIFGLLDKLRNCSEPDANAQRCGPFFTRIPDCDLVVCTDLGTEPADFILSSLNRLIFVHIKCGKTARRPRSAANGIAEVGGQAIKNIEMLVSKNKHNKPTNFSYWAKPWRVDGSPFEIENRVRLCFGKSAKQYMADEKLTCSPDLIDRVWEEIANRRASEAVRKELWIIAGNAFSRQHFFDRLNRGDKRSDESIQAFQLIDSWQTAAAGYDVELTLFVSP